jgi:hypothetical protein
MRKNWKICQKKIFEWEFFVISIKSNLFFGKCFSLLICDFGWGNLIRDFSLFESEVKFESFRWDFNY